MNPHPSNEDHRVAFDFEIEFSNGGGIKGWDFRLDIDGTDISDEALGEYIIKDLRLLMVGSVKILNKKIFRERHKRSQKAEVKVADKDSKASHLIDLSHKIVDGEVTYPGLPAPQLSDYLSHDSAEGKYAPGVTFQIGRIDMVANTGTALDSPYHRFRNGQDISDLPLGDVADLKGVVVRLTGMSSRVVTRAALSATDVAGKAVLIETGWSRRWGNSSYFENHPFLSRDGAEYLRDHGAALVGIDSLNIDDTSDPERPGHTILLGANIPIVENLGFLGRLPIEGFRFNAAPMKVHGIGAFPIRAWARLDLP
jgi:arylformamidase